MAATSLSGLHDCLLERCVISRVFPDVLAVVLATRHSSPTANSWWRELCYHFLSSWRLIERYRFPPTTTSISSDAASKTPKTFPVSPVVSSISRLLRALIWRYYMKGPTFVSIFRSSIFHPGLQWSGVASSWKKKKWERESKRNLLRKRDFIKQ